MSDPSLENSSAALSQMLPTLQGSAEQQSRFQRELIRTITEHAPMAIYFVDAENRITFANPAAERLFGWAARELLGQRLHDMLHHHHADGRPFPAEECIAFCATRDGSSVSDVETVFFRKDGSAVEVLCSLNATPAREGIPRGAVVVAQDISLRKQFEKELLAADQRKNQFLAVLAHELRTPLTAIQAAVEASGDEAAAEDRAWARGVIARQTQQLSRLIEELLDVSRISQGKIRLKREALDAAVATRAAVDAVRPLFAERRHQLSVTIPPHPLPVNADPVRLQQIVVNLLTNAAKYTDEGGRISLTATLESQAVVIRVRDSGVGIAPEMLARLFDPFMQVESSLAQARGGMGIGLPLVRELVRLHGGTITAQSEGAGRGSVFIVQLPAMQEITAIKEVELMKRQEQVDSSRGQRVLLVEDNVDAANGLARMLVRSSHEVAIAFTGAQALSMAEELHPQVVICDIGLPDMDGYELANRLRKLSPDQPLRLMSLSGYESEQHRHRACEAGFDEQFVKPVDLDALRAALAR